MSGGSWGKDQDGPQGTVGGAATSPCHPVGAAHVNVDRVSDMLDLSNFLPVGLVWCIQSIILTAKWAKDYLTVTRLYLYVFCVC